MATTLKALETLALERGRVSAGDVFVLSNKDAAATLVANGSAEEVAEDKSAKSLDTQPDAAKGSVTVKSEKADKPKAEDKDAK